MGVLLYFYTKEKKVDRKRKNITLIIFSLSINSKKSENRSNNRVLTSNQISHCTGIDKKCIFFSKQLRGFPL